MSPPHAPLSSSKEQKGDLSSSVCFEVETRYVQQFIAPHLSWELAVLFLSARNCKCNICLWISNARFFFSFEHSLLFLKRLKTESWLISRIVTYFYHSSTNIFFFLLRFDFVLCRSHTCSTPDFSLRNHSIIPTAGCDYGFLLSLCSKISPVDAPRDQPNVHCMQQNKCLSSWTISTVI